ncbi:MAG: polysaccharide export protein EpsE [Rubrivivax sp.]|nr:polysaccharide export protein EpsE [Rubrivivax sp.]
MRRLFFRLFAAVVLMASLGSSHAQRPQGVTDYVLGPGDVIKITVFQSPELSLDTRIPETGVINYPLLGAVQLGNLTVAAAEKRIADGLLTGKFLKQPQVSILVITQKGNQATVLGHAVRPGRYPLETTSTKLSDLLALAGGVAPDGSDMLTVVGTRDGKPFRKQVDLRTLFRAGSGADDIVIQHNDVVYIDRAAQIYVYGEVQKPGVLRLERGMTVLQALAASGGLTLRGTQRGIRVHRRGADGSVQELTPGLQEPLQQDDVVFVRESLF